MSRPARFALVGASTAGTIGAVVGLVVGLHAYAPTAPFAVIEVGLPATIAGAILGLVAAALTSLAGRIRRWRAPSS